MKDLYATNNNQPVEVRKTLDICPSHKDDPKRFIQVFLTSTDSQIVYLRRIWAILKGLPSSLDVLNHVRDQILETDGVGKLGQILLSRKLSSCLLPSNHQRGTILTGAITVAQLWPQF
ncbi:hypothetical protein PSHT_13966 [Puccinia striiformis]|uniref:Uncharacterized protein n=1 Tax=Puccinia striiformis TaxID=27350 RepID=A0A2S4UML2_9BASI|nr:hypothetical protein PSHT_13966 [Puccinia striiformis]